MIQVKGKKKEINQKEHVGKKQVFGKAYPQAGETGVCGLGFCLVNDDGLNCTKVKEEN